VQFVTARCNLSFFYAFCTRQLHLDATEHRATRGLIHHLEQPRVKIIFRRESGDR
jgi:hypothetical protein